MAAYYNEVEPYAAQWLRNLISAGHIAPGEVDERSIEDVTPNDIKGFTQCHFFAGLGAWSYALRLAKWPDDRPVWTGSCPCQPFSQAGKGDGVTDERHLWPHWFHLIGQCQPITIFGEQVASTAGLAWLDIVHTDLEGAGYAVGASDICAAGIGAPHIRQRIYFVANPAAQRFERISGSSAEEAARATECSEIGWLADSSSQRLQGSGHRRSSQQRRERPSIERACQVGGLADHYGDRFYSRIATTEKTRHWNPINSTGSTDRQHQPGQTNGHWGDADWLRCRDGKWRPVEPGTFPLAHGTTARVGRLRAYGNAIVPQAAAAFITACS